MEEFELAERMARLEAEQQEWLNDKRAQEEYKAYLLNRAIEEMRNLEIGD